MESPPPPSTDVQLVFQLNANHPAAALFLVPEWPLLLLLLLLYETLKRRQLNRSSNTNDYQPDGLKVFMKTCQVF